MFIEDDFVLLRSTGVMFMCLCVRDETGRKRTCYVVFWGKHSNWCINL